MCRKSDRLEWCIGFLGEQTQIAANEQIGKRRARLLNVILPRRITYVQSGRVIEQQSSFHPSAVARDPADRAGTQPVFALAERRIDSSGERTIPRGTGTR